MTKLFSSSCSTSSARACTVRTTASHAPLTPTPTCPAPRSIRAISSLTHHKAKRPKARVMTMGTTATRNLFGSLGRTSGTSLPPSKTVFHSVGIRPSTYTSNTRSCALSQPD